MSMFGFRFRETMRGTYHFLDRPLDERGIEFTIAVVGSGLRNFAKTRTAAIEGDVELEGFAKKTPLAGTLAFKLDERRLPYEFTFAADDGERYRFRGQKDFSIFSVADSISTLPASIYDASGKERGRAIVRFDLRADTGKLLKSFRLRLAS
jgi:hypothetical protein